MINIEREYKPVYNNVYLVREYTDDNCLEGLYFILKEYNEGTGFTTVLHIDGDDIDIPDASLNQIVQTKPPEVITKKIITDIETQANVTVETTTILYEVEPSAISICRVENDFGMFLTMSDNLKIPLLIYTNSLLDKPTIVVDTKTFDDIKLLEWLVTKGE